MWIVKNRKIFFIFSGLLVLLSIVVVFVWGLQPGIEFTGGTLIEINYTDGAPEVLQIESRLDSLAIGSYTIQETGDNGFLIRTRDLDETERETLLDTLTIDEKVPEQERITTIGPSIGQELRRKSYLAIGIVVLAIILFVAFSFRRVSKPVSSWKYGFVAILALIHDIIIPTGFFALLGHFASAEVDVLFVTALLAILGFSVNDTIVVFDRIRENLSNNKETGHKEPFYEVVGRSLDQTIARSINTSLTTLLVLITLFFIGGDSTKLFALTLIMGVIFGTYSSIFLASPILIALSREES